MENNMDGKCQGCDSYGEVNDIMLCDSCAEKLEEADYPSPPLFEV